MVLAQLLIQFQKPIITENPLQNGTNQLTNDTFATQFNQSSLNRVIRSIPNDENSINAGVAHAILKERYIAPEDFSNGKPFDIKMQILICNFHFFFNTFK